MIEFDSRYFEPKATLECGQVFRYTAVGQQDYIIRSADKTARVSMRGDTTYIDCDSPDYFKRYFDLDRDYGAVIERLSRFEELKECVQTGRGIRILKQNLTETILSFIISANNNIPRIKAIIERLCDNFGKDMGEYRAFPALPQLKEVTVQQYRDLGCGFRDRYLHDTVDKLLTTDIMQRIVAADTVQAGKLLCTLSGVGQKVADCILLFGMGRSDCYPVDTWIFKANRNESLNTPQKVRQYYLDRYGLDAGFAQQYIFYKVR